MYPLPLEPLEAVAAFLIATAAASVQSVAGFGLALVAAPLLLLIYGPFIPGPMMAGGLLLTILILRRDHQHVDVSGLTFSILGRVVGTVGAAGFLVVASEALFNFAFAGFVILAVLLSMAGLRPEPNRRNALVAGTLSGLMGTLSSIGGPPMALLYQGSGASRLRGTLAGFFLLGSLVSLAALALVGRFGLEEVILSLFLAVPMVLGYRLAEPLRNRMPEGAVRPLVLGLSMASAAIVLLRTVF